MSRDGAIVVTCVVFALAFVLGALRCLADHLLVSAAIYTALSLALLGGALYAAAAAF